MPEAGNPRGGGGANPAAGLKTGTLGGGAGITPGAAAMVDCGVNPAGEGGWARAPAIGPSDAPKPGGRGGSALFLRACAARRRSAEVP